MHLFGNWQGHWFGGGLMMVMFYIVMAFILTAFFRYLFGKGTTNDSSLEILKKRYAAGEITKEQFEEMKSNILP